MSLMLSYTTLLVSGRLCAGVGEGHCTLRWPRDDIHPPRPFVSICAWATIIVIVVRDLDELLALCYIYQPDGMYISDAMIVYGREVRE